MQLTKEHLWVLSTLLVVCVLSGLSFLTLPVLTSSPGLVLPEALGLPSLIPPLRLSPLGESTWAFWAIDVIGVAMLLLATGAQLAANGKPARSRLRAYGATCCAVVTGLVAANVVRMVLQTFLTDSSLGSFAGSVLSTALLSAATGLLLGLVVGLVVCLGLSVDAGLSPLLGRDRRRSRS